MKEIYIGLFLIELIKCWDLTVTLFSEKLKRNRYSVIAFGIYTVFVLVSDIRVIDTRLFMYLFVIALQLVTQEGTKKLRVFKIITVCLMMVLIDELISVVNNIIMINFYGRAIDNDITAIIDSLTALLVIIVIYVLKKRAFFDYRFINDMEIKINIFLFMVEIELVTTITMLNFIKNYINHISLQIGVTVLSIFAFLCIGIVVILVISMRETSERVERLIETKRELKRMQKEYYQILLEKESNIKAYQHDMGNHLICLMELAYEENVNQVMDYMKGLKNGLIHIQKQLYQTGNFIIDIILIFCQMILKNGLRENGIKN